MSFEKIKNMSEKEFDLISIWRNWGEAYNKIGSPIIKPWGTVMCFYIDVMKYFDGSGIQYTE